MLAVLALDLGVFNRKDHVIGPREALSWSVLWVALALAVNTVSRSAANAATTLGAAWVLLVLVAPTLLNVVVETLYPTPSRPELVAAGRKASSTK